MGAKAGGLFTNADNPERVFSQLKLALSKTAMGGL
jgi:hypothetical protein